MEYPFRMYGEIVEIYRYQITYTEGEEPESQQVTQGFPTLEEAQAEGDRHSVTPEPLDTTAYAWMEGLTFPTRNDAMKAYDMGESEYGKTKNAPSQIEQLAAKIDYISMMSGIEIPGGGIDGA